MALVANDIILQAKRRLAAISPGLIVEGFEIDIAACLPSALGSLAIKVMRDDSKRALLQQDYSVTLTSGVGNLLTATGSLTSVADIIAEGVYWGTVVDADGDILQPIKNYSSFVRPQPSVFSYYCLKNERIHTRSRNESFTIPSEITGVTGPLTVTASFAPTLATHCPDELADDLIDELCEIVLTKIPEKTTAKSK